MGQKVQWSIMHGFREVVCVKRNCSEHEAGVETGILSVNVIHVWRTTLLWYCGAQAHLPFWRQAGSQDQQIPSPEVLLDLLPLPTKLKILFSRQILTDISHPLPFSFSKSKWENSETWPKSAIKLHDFVVGSYSKSRLHVTETNVIFTFLQILVTTQGTLSLQRVCCTPR